MGGTVASEDGARPARPLTATCQISRRWSVKRGGERSGFAQPPKAADVGVPGLQPDPRGGTSREGCVFSAAPTPAARCPQG